MAVLSAASMTLSNLAAFFQQDVKRLLAYSTISQVGYLLMPVAVARRADLAQQAPLFYLAGYALTNLGAFAVVCALPGLHNIDDYRGLARQRPALADALVVCLLGLVGTPPTAVFLGKLEAFSVAATPGGRSWPRSTPWRRCSTTRWIAPAVSAGRNGKTPGTGGSRADTASPCDGNRTAVSGVLSA